MVIILFKKTSFSSKTQTDWQTAFFAFFIVSTNKLKTNCILFFTEIMDSFSPKKGAASSSKGKNSYIPTRCFLVRFKKKKIRKVLWFFFWFDKLLLPRTDFSNKRTFLEQSFVSSFYSCLYLDYLFINFYR